MSRGRPRRLRGEGSVWRRRDGRYGARVRLAAGGVRNITKPTQEAVLAEIKRLRQSGQVAGGKGTFGEWLDSWLSSVRRSLRAKTYESYEAVVRLHLKPACGEVRLSRLTAKHIEEAMDAAEKKHLSSSSVAYVRTVARIALHAAVTAGAASENVAKLAGAVTVDRKEVQPFSAEEFAAYKMAIDGTRLEVAFLLPSILGPRKGEILGLQWSDVTEREVALPSGEVVTVADVRISRQVQRLAKKGLVVVPVKTKRARRIITLPPEITERLESHRRRQLEERMRAGERWTETGHIFTTRTGGIIDPRRLLDVHYAMQAKAKITPRRSFHALRHTSATAMQAAGVPMKAISAMLGHTSERFTSETYTHMVPELEAQVLAVASSRAKKK